MTRKYRRHRGGVRRTTSRSTQAAPPSPLITAQDLTPPPPPPPPPLETVQELIPPPPPSPSEPSASVAPTERYKPKDKAELKKSIKGYPANKLSYGDINTWDVTLVTDMAGLFARLTKFNEDISAWDVSNVTTMSKMFYSVKAFNQPLGSWNVGNVTDMSNMFHEAKSFNQPLDSWNVSNVKNMAGMFLDAKAFNQPLNSWVVSNVEDMGFMFNGASAFNQPLNSWDVSNVKRMDEMFINCHSFRQSLIEWNVENVRNLRFFSNNYYFLWPRFSSVDPSYSDRYCDDVADFVGLTRNMGYYVPPDIGPIDGVNTYISVLTRNRNLSATKFEARDILKNTAALPLEESSNRANPNDEGYDLMNLENVKVSDYLNSDPNNVVFYMNEQVLFFANKTTIRNILLGRGSSIKYKCLKVSTALVPQLENLDRTNPYVSLNSLGGTSGGLVLLGAMKSVLTDSSIRIIEIVTPEIDNAVSTASLSMLSPDPSSVSASHCQEGQGDKIYALKKMTMETSGGNKRRSKRRTKRSGKRTKKIMKRRHHYRNTRR
jgi:surface protein